MKRSEWYEKYIGYMFANGEILTDIYTYDDGRKCYEMWNPETKTGYICDYSEFKEIAKSTALPK